MAGMPVPMEAMKAALAGRAPGPGAEAPPTPAGRPDVLVAATKLAGAIGGGLTPEDVLTLFGHASQDGAEDAAGPGRMGPMPMMRPGGPMGGM